MPKTTITSDAWICLRCGHKWISRNDIQPLRCADCRTPYWNKEKINGVEAH